MFGKIIFNAMVNAQSAIPVNENDYEKDGILYCGNCHTPKQAQIVFNGIELKPMCLCKCLKEKYEEKERKERKEQRKIRVERNRIDSLHERKFCEYTFQNDSGNNKKIIETCHKYVMKWSEVFKDNIGLLFWGDTGNGKTFAAACIANYLIDNEISVCMTSFPAILNDLSGFTVRDKNEYIDELCDVDLLIIDDLGCERQSDFAMEIVYSVIDARYCKKKPMIITTNVMLDEMKQTRDLRLKRIYSRILEMCVPVLFSSEDERLKIAKEKRNALADYLTKGIEDDKL